MDRFRSTHCLPPVRALLLGIGAAALWLYATDHPVETSRREIMSLLSDTAELRGLALEGLHSFGLIALALIIGLSFALALAIVLQSFGQVIAKTTGWLGRLIADVAPMAWGFATMLLLARGLELPIPGLLPDSVANQTQDWEGWLGRKIWQWLVPAITLAIPVFGSALYSLTHQLDEWQRDPALGKLKARGLSRSVIFYRYLMPRVWQHLVCLARPGWGWLMVAAIPVEKLLGFSGWGRRLAEAFLNREPLPTATVLVLGGMLLALGSFLIQSLEQRSPFSREASLQDASRLQNKGVFILGLLLMVSLMMLPQWLPFRQWRLFQGAYEAWWPEVSLALFSSMVMVAAVFPYSFAMSLSRKNPGRKKTRLVSLTRLLVRFAVMGGFFYFLKAWGFAGLVIGGVVLHGLVRAHEVLREMYASDRVLSARSLGRATYGIWRHHILPNLMPSLLHWAFWNTAHVLWIVTLIRFCVPAAASPESWGQQMQRAADAVLEYPMPAFAPAILLALWCLSFRMISRAFPVRSPSLPTSPFATR